MRLLAPAALIASLFAGGCETTVSFDDCGFQPGMRAAIPGFCTDRVAALGIAGAARDDPALTAILLQGAISAGACHYSGLPVAGIIVDAVADVFRDYRGRLTQVLEGRLAGDSRERVFAIVLARLAKRPQPSHCADSPPQALTRNRDFALLR